MSNHDIRLPAEWEPQSGVLLTWPHSETDWRDDLEEVESVFIDISKHLCQQTKLIIVCNDKLHKTHIDTLLKYNSILPGQYKLYIASSNDSWARDHGPITVLENGKPVILDFQFNGWGNKYPAELDNKISSKLCQQGTFKRTSFKTIDFVLEGGSIESDGEGTLMVAKSCLLSPNRNNNLEQKCIETKLTELLGVSRIFYIHNSQLSGDDTDGHIDNLVRFINTEIIFYIGCKDKNNPDYNFLNRMKNELRQLKQINGNPYKLIELPLPHIITEEGKLLPASYANFLISNNTVLVPQYGVPSDDEVLDIFNNFFVDQKIIRINCKPLIRQFGSLHCITMQFPSGVIT